LIFEGIPTQSFSYDCSSEIVGKYRRATRVDGGYFPRHEHWVIPTNSKLFGIIAGSKVFDTAYQVAKTLKISCISYESIHPLTWEN